ncbi:YbaB/EbfC family nucleoid-associated protein [Nonomuraea sp. NPDC050451]|uniref:YbaB/EbfC family nucleoid-associated protein n=1 Tax=Nonomuraea sp. NPDC050451 TaxID=3364364 RepID=UPI0037ABF86C
MRPSSMEEDRDYLDRLLTQAETMMRSLAGARARLGRITGTGEAAGGLVSAVADGHGRVRELVVDPRGMRLGAEALGRELGEAMRAAQRDAERQVHDLMAELDAQTPRLPEALGADFVQERVEQVSREIEARMGSTWPGQ